MDEEYIKIEHPVRDGSLESKIHLKNYQEFGNALNLIRPEAKYKWDDGVTTQVGFLSNGFLHYWIIPKHFPSVDEWVEARNQGFKDDYEGYIEMKRHMEELKCKTLQEVMELPESLSEYGIDGWIHLRKIGFKNPEEVHEAEKMGFLSDYIGKIALYWEFFESDDLKDFRIAKKDGFKDVDKFYEARVDLAEKMRKRRNKIFL